MTLPIEANAAVQAFFFALFMRAIRSFPPFGAKAFPVLADSVSRAVVGAILFAAVEVFEAFDAFALAFVADSVSAAVFGAFVLDGAVVTEEAFVADAAAVYAFSVAVAVANFLGAVFALPACFAGAFSVVAFSVVRAEVWA